MRFFQIFKAQLHSLSDFTELIAEGNPCHDSLVQDLEMVNLPQKIFKIKQACNPNAFPSHSYLSKCFDHSKLFLTSISFTSF